MNKTDVTRALIEMLVSKSIKDVATDPHRSIRNLVEMGQIFSTGASQRDFFDACSTMLENEDSAYYTMLEDAVAYIAPDKIIKLGINIGYNGCTLGVKKMRDYEAETGIRLPWLVYFSVSGNEGDLTVSRIDEIISQAHDSGTCTFILKVGPGMIPAVIPIIKKYSDAGFILLVRPDELSDSDINELKEIDNVLVSLETAPEEQEDALFARCAKLHYWKCPYAVYMFYNDDNAGRVLDNTWINSIEPAGATFAFLFPSTDTSEKTIEQIRQYVLDIRANQEYPFILMESVNDINIIDQVVAMGPASLGVTAKGELFKNRDRSPFGTIVNQTLADALKAATPADEIEARKKAARDHMEK